MYRGYVIGLVIRQGIPPQDAEDVANDILLREIELDVIGQYNPEYYSEHQGRQIHVSFKSFLSNKVCLRVKGKRDQIQRRSSREPLICDSTVDDGGTRWIETFGGAVWDDYSELSTVEFVSRMREYLATVPRRSDTDACDLVALFDELLRQIKDEGQVTSKGLQETFGIGDSTAASWLARLRQIMTQAGDELPRPEPRVICGITLSLTEVHSAIAVLRASKGIMVKQPLQRAGHPLAKAPDGWYHQFSLEERKLFPELEVDPQTHKKPAGHVKLAVIHRLERMLGVGMADEPAPPEPTPSEVLTELGLGVEPEGEITPLELIEARLWQLGASDKDVAEILALAQAVSVS
jgi:hypothetical protein